MSLSQQLGLGYTLSIAAAEAKQPILLIVPDSLTAARLQDELEFFMGNQPIPLLHFPDWETLPYDQFSPHHDIISERLATLHKIPSLQRGIIIISINTLMQRLPPSSFLDAHTFLLRTGEQLDINSTRARLEKAGYYCVNQVREHGEFAVRGSIIDLYPMGVDQPYRIDLLDDEVDSIRTFSPETQRSLETVAEIRLLPAKEFPRSEETIEYFRQQWRSRFSGNPLNCPTYQDMSEGIAPPGIEYYLPLFFDKTASLWDYLPKNTAIINLTGVDTQAEIFWQEINHRYAQGRHDTSRPLLPPAELFIDPAQTIATVNRYPGHYIENTLKPVPTLTVEHKSAKPLALLQEYVDKFQGRILFCAETTGRREILLQLFQTINIRPKIHDTWQAFLTDDNSYGLVVSPMEEGFQMDQPKLAVITETHLFGKRIMQRRLRKKSVQDTEAIIRDLSELQIGDPVVHIDHGVGRYLGLQTLTVSDQLAEFLTLEYADETKLYVPVASLHLISRYTGTDSEHAPINRLGTEQWQKAKRKAVEQVRDVAAELLDVYSKRLARPGISFNAPGSDYENFAAAFPFEETPDQAQAIEKVIEDMVSGKPMDRLICGDVGFGKTEVAMRAAFMAVQSGKQVAVLVPTTLLAQQHYRTFLDRFADWPIQIDTVSRFRTEKEQKGIIERMLQGKLDIIIGTHKLLQENIKFKSLGLVIIDEEHRFGVRQKERLKALRSEVDILTMTATPIPRTLNMAFSGVRDLSIIATPPARRLSVKTFVYEYQDHVIQEAIRREILRGGQVYFLHNEVSTIERKREELQVLIPEARIGIAHGQMHERELEQVMADFYHRRFNVLLCSTIIESGIDIPTANTIIINRADKFGIAQLHQLRGRVGRSHHQAYAYLLIHSRKLLTKDAEKRLDAVALHEELGIGFTLATHDLEIRGAGELLGEEQSGNMHAIGFSLYMELLARAVDALKEGKEIDLEKTISHGPEINLQITALIPQKYLDDVHLRLQIYKRIAHAKNQAELDEIQVEMIDRFGLFPDPLKNLFAITELKFKAAQLGIVKIEASSKGGRIDFNEKPNVDPMKIIHLIQKQSHRFKLAGAQHLKFTLPDHPPQNRIQLINAVLMELSEGPGHS